MNDDTGRKAKAKKTPTVAAIEVEAYRQRGPSVTIEEWRERGFLIDEVMIDEQTIFLLDPDLDDFMRTRNYRGTISEADLADFFVGQAHDKVRFDHGQGAWFVWSETETYWKQDGRRIAFEAIRRLNMAMSEGQSASKKEKYRKAVFASGVERFARVDQRVSILPDAWDTNRDLLGTPGGTIDLVTGTIRAPDPSDMISKVTACAPSFETPTQWLTFLGEATGNDQEMIRFLQRWSGYALTGHTREEQLAFLYGPGGNGKGVFLLTLTRILGPYSVTAPMALFVASDYEKHSTDMAMLRGARLVTAQETQAHHRWDEERLKVLTGGDVITARFLYQNNFSFRPQFTLMMSGNSTPALTNVNDAIIRRLNIVPFVHKPATVDDKLKDRLFDQEGPQILGWMVEGARRWYAEGLFRPKAVKDETQKYFSDQNTLERWIAEDCEVRPGVWDKTGRLYGSYVNSLRGDAHKPIAKNLFSTALADRGFQRGKNEYGRIFHGIKALGGDYEL